MKSPHTKNTLLKFAQGNRTCQKWQVSISPPNKIDFKNPKRLKKIRNVTHSRNSMIYTQY
jgi:hypothetical protein